MIVYYMHACMHIYSIQQLYKVKKCNIVQLTQNKIRSTIVSYNMMSQRQLFMDVEINWAYFFSAVVLEWWLNIIKGRGLITGCGL
jgi:hypothetical protein